jgi:hypothetical protein
MDFGTGGCSRRIVSIAGLLLTVVAICGCGHIQSSSQQNVTLLVDPASASVQISKTLKFNVQVSNTSNTAVTWQVNGVTGGDSAHGTIDANGMYTAPKTVPVPPTVTITAISQAQPTVLDTAQVTVMGAGAQISVSVAPATASVEAGKTHSITAMVANDTQNKGVTWAMSGAGCTGAACGTLSAASSASGVAITYTAPTSVPSPGTVTLTAKSVTDTSKTASATITVTAAALAITVAVNPTSASVQTGKAHSVTATVSNDPKNKGVTWTLSGAGCTGASCGTLSAASSASGAAITYTAPAGVPSPANVTLTAKSVADINKTAATAITITATPVVSVAVNPTSASVVAGKTHGITATVTNDTQNKGVTWTLNGAGCTGAACGTLSAVSSASGAAITYTAPASVPSPANVTLTAKSVADTSKTAVATITITAPPAVAVSVNPTSASAQTGKTQSVTATVTNDAQNKGVTWTLSGAGCAGASCGTLSAASSASGAAITYTAPASVPSPATVTLTAKSVADTSKAAAAMITVTPPPAVAVSVNPTSASVQTGLAKNVTATVTNDSQNKGVTWTLTGAGCAGATCGTLSAASSASGAAIIYTAPASVPTPATVTLTAQSVADASKTAVSGITVVPPPPIVVVANPVSASVATGLTKSVTATLTNDLQNKGVNWTLSGTGCSGATCGTLSATSSASGAAITYTAPASVPTPALVTLKAQSVTDASKTAVTTITITAAPPVGVTVNPTTASVQTGLTKSVTATVTNDPQNKGLTWTLTGAGCTGATCGTLSATSSASGTAIVYSAPASVPTPAIVTLTARSVADVGKTAVTTITITLPPPVVIAVNPTSTSVQIGQTQNFSATVANDPQNKGVTWILAGVGCAGASCGTLSATSSASGAAITYTAPATAPTPAIVLATATSVFDITKTTVVTITITSVPVTVTVSPVRVGLTTGQLQAFAANASGSSTAVTWEVDTIPGGNSSIGTISAAGVYTPPSNAGTHTVGARSVADSTVVATASVAITDLAGVLTYHNDLTRAGVNNKEYALNTSNVKTATFGKRFACSIDAAAYAQPLWVANVAIGGGTHNVVIAATQHDTIYVFDADASPCHTYWSKSLLGSGETWVGNGDVGSGDITPDIGIVGTPVIDGATKTIYVVSKSKSGSTFHQRLHALSLIDGSEKFSGPQDIAFTSNGITFSPLRENERCGLALVNGVVYIAYASHGDQQTYYGWVVGYNASTLAQTAVFNDDPGFAFGGIWMSGGAPAADSSNNLYVITGNGVFDGTSNFGDSFLKLSTGGSIGVASFFAPSNQGDLNNNDTDLGAGGAAILIDAPAAPVPHLVIGGGKQGFLYLLNRDSLGGNNSTDSGAVQIFNAGNGIFATPAFWQNNLYLAGVNGHVKAFAFDGTTGKFTTAPSSQSPTGFGFPGSTPSVSAQGTSNGIVWATERVSGSSSVLHAYDATNLNNELWNSNSGSGNQAGQSVKFTVPTVANGKVYVGTAGEISVYGLSPN